MLAKRVRSGQIFDMADVKLLVEGIRGCEFYIPGRSSLLTHLATDLLNRTAENGADIAHPDGVLFNQDLICA